MVLIIFQSTFDLLLGIVVLKKTKVIMRSQNLFTIFILLIICISSESLSQESVFVSEEESIWLANLDGSKRRPQLLLFSCNYGAGHKMAAQGIVQSLPDCDVHVVDIYQGPLKSLDPLRWIFSEFNNEKIYNDLAKHEYNRLLNWIAKVAPNALVLQQRNIERLLISYLQEQRPDLLISCIPLINPMLMAAARQVGIPLIVITTDIDISAFCFGFEEQEQLADKKKFRMTVPYASEHFHHQHYSQFLRHSFQYKFGYPTRRAFSEEADRSALDLLRIQYGINDDEHVILVMMGGNTAQAAKTYAQLLLEMSDREIDRITDNLDGRNNIRLICLCGDVKQDSNRSLMVHLNALNCASCRKNQRVQIHACPGTPHIAQIASLPELRTVISKPGGSTVNEMIKKKIPMVYHVSNVTLDWECGNMEYGEARNLGRRYQIQSKISFLARREFVEILSYTFALHPTMRANPESVPEAEIDFSRNLRTAVKDML